MSVMTVYRTKSYWTKFKKMPLTKKGKKIKSAMAKTYGAKKGENVFYASINKGKIKGAEKKSAKKKK